MQNRENFYTSAEGEDIIMNKMNQNENSQFNDETSDAKRRNAERILEEITKSPLSSTAVRQKSLFTANPLPTARTKFNVSAPPFLLSPTASPTYRPEVSGRNVHSLNNYRHYPFEIGSSASASFNYGPPIPPHNVPSMPHMLLPPPPIFDKRILRNSYSSGHVSVHRPDYDDFNSPMPSTSSNYYNNKNMFTECDTLGNYDPIVLSNGIIQLRLRDGIRIDMTVDKAIRVVNQRSHVAMALSSRKCSSALIHPNGRVFQYGSKVEIVCYDGLKNNDYVRYAKMWYKGISFTSKNCALTYLVDTAGTRTTSDTFTDMSNDNTLTVFFSEARYGSNLIEEAASIVQDTKFIRNKDGSDVYEINGFRIIQSSDGLVKITCNNNKFLLRTSPGNGSATLTTNLIHCTASLGKTSHLFVRKGERRMHFDGSAFVVRNAGHSAGFDKNNLLNVY